MSPGDSCPFLLPVPAGSISGLVMGKIYAGFLSVSYSSSLHPPDLLSNVILHCSSQQFLIDDIVSTPDVQKYASSNC